MSEGRVRHKQGADTDQYGNRSIYALAQNGFDPSFAFRLELGPEG
jgi:hypothetical protein